MRVLLLGPVLLLLCRISILLLERLFESLSLDNPKSMVALLCKRMSRKWFGAQVKAKKRGSKPFLEYVPLV